MERQGSFWEKPKVHMVRFGQFQTWLSVKHAIFKDSIWEDGCAFGLSPEAFREAFGGADPGVPCIA